MTADEFRSCLDTLVLSQRGLARMLGRDDRLVRRWATGECDIPTDVGDWLMTLAAFHSRHRPPERRTTPGSDQAGGRNTP
jgi:hypothetical protein